MSGTIANVEDLQKLKAALISLSKALTDIDGNITLAVQRVHAKWDDDMYNGFKKTYNKYKQRIVESADQYEKFAKGPLQTKINELIVIEKELKKMNQ